MADTTVIGGGAWAPADQEDQDFGQYVNSAKTGSDFDISTVLEIGGTLMGFPGVGSLIGGLFGKKGAKDQNVASAAAAQKQMDFQERMSSTAHQREVADLRKAGLNPILSAHKGASTPQGATYQPSNVGEAAVSSALKAAQATTIQYQNNLLQAQTAQSAAAAKRELADATYIGAKTMSEFRNVEKIEQDTITSQSQQQLNNAMKHNVVAQTAVNESLVQLNNASTKERIQAVKNMQEQFHHLAMIGKVSRTAAAEFAEYTGRYIPHIQAGGEIAERAIRSIISILKGRSPSTTSTTSTTSNSRGDATRTQTSTTRSPDW